MVTELTGIMTGRLQAVCLLLYRFVCKKKKIFDRGYKQKFQWLLLLRLKRKCQVPSILFWWNGCSVPRVLGLGSTLVSSSDVSEFLLEYIT